MDAILKDLRYGLRMLAKQPGFTLIAVLSLAFGIGANTAIFSLVNAALLRPLPIDRPEQLVALNNTAQHRTFPAFSYPNYRDFRDRNDVFSGLIGYRWAPLSISHDGINERLWGYVVTGNYFEVLGVKAALGRLISTEDDVSPGGHPVAVLAYKYWRERFGARPDIIGMNVLVNGRGYAIIGVAAEGFFGTEIISAPDIWFPLSMQAQIEVGNDWLDDRQIENIFIQGRLKPGVSIAQAQSSMNGIAAELEREFPEINEGKRVLVSPAGMLGRAMRGQILGFSGLLMVVVGLVLLLACTNLANLMLARAAERRREIAVRLAMGASRARLIRQLLTESTMLAVTGGILGLLLATWLVDLAAAFKPPLDVPLSFELHIDYRVLIFTAALSLATGVLFGLLPAWQSTKENLSSALKDEMAAAGYRGSWLKNGLIAFQIALSLMLLIGGGLLLRGLQQAQTLDLGFETEGAVEVSFDLRLQGYNESRGREFQRALLERLRTVPGVEAAGLADIVPVDLHISRVRVYPEGQPPERERAAPIALTNRVSPGYFAAMGTRLLQGRDFSDQDTETSARVVIVNETFARRFWPGENPVGKRFSLNPERPPMEIVGVAANGKYAGLTEDPRPFVFRPLYQSYSGSTYVVVRSALESHKTLAAVRAEVARLDPNIPIATAGTLAERLSLPLLPARVAAGAMGSFGLLALGLAAIGIYGVMSYSVSRRRREMGIRMALGAQRTDVLKMILGQGMSVVLIGVVAGLAASVALTRFVEALLFGVSPTDPLTFGLIVVLLMMVALVACWLPARRATKVDPMVALRYE